MLRIESIKKCLHTSGLTIALTLIVAAPALAQIAIGNFQAPIDWWVGPGTTTGVLPDALRTTLTIDVDGDGSVNGAADHSHPYPGSLESGLVSSSVQYRLSPQRDVLYVFGTAVSGCSGSQAVSIYLYRIPTTDGAALQPLVEGECFALGTAQQGFFQSAVPVGNDIFFLAERAHPTQLTQRLFWVDLNTGATNTLFPNLDQDIGAITFDPNGMVALVQSAVGGTPGADYHLVGLCDAAFGQAYSATGFPLNGVTGSILTGSLIVATDSSVDILVRQDTTDMFQTDLVDCSDTPPVVGACCLPDGSCSDGLTQAACEGGTLNGTWQGDGSTCATSNCPQPPTPSLAFSVIGPSSGPVLTPLVYTFSWSNQGTGVAHNVVANITIPFGPTLAGYTPGGGWNPGTRRLQYSLGDVAPGTNGSVEVTLTADCGINSWFINSYFLTSTEQGIVFGAPSLGTSITQPSSLPVGITVQSVADAGEPVLNEQTITHTFTLDNANGSAATAVHFQYIDGVYQDHETVVDNGGGVFTSQGTLHTWIGDVPAMSQVQLVVRARLSPCRPPSVVSSTLNNGGPVLVRNTCNAVLGLSTAPAALSLGDVPLGALLTITNLPQPSGDWFNGADPRYLAQSGDRLEARLQMQNQYNTPLATASLTVAFPTGFLPDGDPPFLGPVPAGIVWDAATQRITWSGSLAAQETLDLRWAMFVEPSAACTASFSTQTTVGTCGTTTAARLFVSVLAPPLPDPHLLMLDAFSGVSRAPIGGGALAEDWICGFWEVAFGLGEGAGGDLWIVGVPVIRLNPGTRELEVFGADLINRLDMVIVNDMAIGSDPDVIYFCGISYVGPFGQSTLRVAAWDRITDTVTALFTETGLPPLYREPTNMFVDATGQLAVMVGGGILRVDPATPGTAMYLAVPALPFGIATACKAPTGSNYVIAPNIFDTTSAAPLLMLDPVTGSATELVPDLRAYLPLDVQPFVAAELGPGNHVFLQQRNKAWTEDFDLVTPPVRTVVPHADNNISDVEWYGGMTTSPVVADQPELPREVAVKSIVPNPFNPRTRIAYTMPREGQARVVVHDLRGRLVRTLWNGPAAAGAHELIWQGQDDRGQAVASGVYFVRISALGKSQVRKAVLLR